MHKIIANGGKEKYPDKFQAIHAAINKHGIENFSFQIIETFDMEKDALEAEMFWIAFFKGWAY